MSAYREIDTQLNLLRDRLLLLGGKTEDAVHRAVRSLTNRDSELAKSVCEDDKQIDQMELEIDRLSIEILGMQQFAEHDLRLVVSVAKITPILERIADHASSIAKAAIVLNNEPQIDSYIDFSQMAEIAAAMLGPYAQLWGDQPRAPEDGRWAFQSLFAHRFGIAGGTDQIQRNIIGDRLLGLPR